MKFILLGSGAVRPDLEHWGPAQAVQVNGENLLFDCGRGASMRLVEAGIPLQSIRRTFFTHHHYDHNCDFAYLFLTSWVLGRDFRMQVIGPRGTRAFCDGLFRQAYRDDIASRRGHLIYSEEGEHYEVVEVTDETSEIQGNGYAVKMIHIKHKDPVLDNLAFRVEAGGKSIVVVGDTTVCENLMEFSEGADLLVHECSFPSDFLIKEEWDAFHTPPKALGVWAKERGVKKLLLKHFCLRPGVVELEPMVAEVKAGFGDRNLLVGHDLMTVEV